MNSPAFTPQELELLARAELVAKAASKRGDDDLAELSAIARIAIARLVNAHASRFFDGERIA